MRRRRDYRKTIGFDSMNLTKYAQARAPKHYADACETLLGLLDKLWPKTIVHDNELNPGGAVIVWSMVNGTEAETRIVEFDIPIRKTVKVGARWQWAHVDVVAAVAVVKKITAEFPEPQFSLEYEGLKCAAGFVVQINRYMFG